MSKNNKSFIVLIMVGLLVLVLGVILILLIDSLPERCPVSALASSLLWKFAVLILPLLNVFFLYKYWHLSKQEISTRKFTEEDDAVMHMENLYNDIQGKIHDYNNHLQVLYGLVQKENRSDAKKYMDELVREAMLDYETLYTKQPAINSLLHYKLGLAKSKGIDVDIYVSTDLSDFDKKPTDFCRVFGNIITNAIEALVNLAGKKDLIVIIRKEKGFVFEVINNGPAIPHEKMRSLFKAGYSTKKTGQGMGLYNAYKITKGLGGDLTVESNKEETVFRMYFPEKEGHYELREKSAAI